MPARTKRGISADDLYRLQLISDCQISPDGRHVVFGVQRVDRENEKKYANLWVVPTDRGPARQFTYGNQVDASPRWSPDGGQIAFISNRGEEKQPQIHVIPFHGGEARPLTNLKGEFGPFEWSPDGKQLVCQFRKKDEEVIAREEDEQNYLYRMGFSKKMFPNSRHNAIPPNLSEAVDICPHPVDWQDDEKFYYVAGIVMGTAHKHGIKLRWGGDWDMDDDLHDQTFMDLGHFEVVA